MILRNGTLDTKFINHVLKPYKKVFKVFKLQVKTVNAGYVERCKRYYFFPLDYWQK